VFFSRVEKPADDIKSLLFLMNKKGLNNAKKIKRVIQHSGWHTTPKVAVRPGSSGRGGGLQSRGIKKKKHGSSGVISHS
jgi:hypothetical protein